MANKNLFKKNYILFLVIFISICFGCILSNSLKVNAYHLDEQTGNIVSDNLISFSNNSGTIEGITYTLTENNILIVEGTSTWDVNLFISLNEPIIDGTYSYNSFFEKPEHFELFLAKSDGDYSDRVNISSSGIFTSNYTYNYLQLFIYRNTTIPNLTIKPMVVNGDSIPTSYEPYGKIYFYGQQSYDEAYQSGYNNGYDVGFVENNSIPNIYVSSATYMFRTNLSGAEVVYRDVGSLIGGFSGVLDYSFAFTYDYPIFAYKGQSPMLTVSLLTFLSIDDILKFDLSNIEYISNLESVAIIFFDTNQNLVSLTYQQIIDNNFEFSLKDIYPDISLTEIAAMMINYRYNGDDVLSGIRSMTDISFVMDSNEHYDLGYKVGYITGKNDGLVSGEELGYDKGYKEGYKKASQVVSKPGNNTLVGMVGTLIETPVNMFIDIFNFEFLGVNLVAFFFSLLTLLVVLWLIKYLK